MGLKQKLLYSAYLIVTSSALLYFTKQYADDFLNKHLKPVIINYVIQQKIKNPIRSDARELETLMQRAYEESNRNSKDRQIIHLDDIPNFDIG